MGAEGYREPEFSGDRVPSIYNGRICGWWQWTRSHVDVHPLLNCMPGASQDGKLDSLFYHGFQNPPKVHLSIFRKGLALRDFVLEFWVFHSS